MTRSENMRRLWSDPEFRERARQRQSATMTATNRRQWTSEKRAEQSARMKGNTLSRGRREYLTVVARETEAA